MLTLMTLSCESAEYGNRIAILRWLMMCAVSCAMYVARGLGSIAVNAGKGFQIQQSSGGSVTLSTRGLGYGQFRTSSEALLSSTMHAQGSRGSEVRG